MTNPNDPIVGNEAVTNSRPSSDPSTSSSSSSSSSSGSSSSSSGDSENQDEDGGGEEGEGEETMVPGFDVEGNIIWLAKALPLESSSAPSSLSHLSLVPSLVWVAVPLVGLVAL